MYKKVYAWIKKNLSFLITSADLAEKEIKRGKRFSGVVRAVGVLLLFIILGATTILSIWIIFYRFGTFMTLIASILVLFIIFIISRLITIFVQTIKKK